MLVVGVFGVIDDVCWCIFIGLGVEFGEMLMLLGDICDEFDGFVWVQVIVDYLGGLLLVVDLVWEKLLVVVLSLVLWDGLVFVVYDLFEGGLV